MVFGSSTHRLFAVAVAIGSIGLFTTPGHAIRLVASPGQLPTAIPAACRASLATNIACGPRLIHASDIEREVPFNATFLGEYCNSTCTQSLKQFSDGVASRCGNTIYDFGAGEMMSGNMVAAPLQWAQNLACTTENGTTTSSFCWPKVVAHNTTTCDKCTLKYLAGHLSSPVGNGKIDEKGFSSLVSSCGAKPTDFPHSTSTVPLPTSTPTVSPNVTCWGGANYTVKSGDSCASIADAKSMAIDNFLYLNGIDFKCTTLTVGSILCIRDSCKLYKIKSGDTCKQIMKDNGFSMNELKHWNPILETGCDDLTTFLGRSICITPPGSNTYNGSVTATFNDTWVWPSGSWVAGPTQGTPLVNATTDWVPPIQTTTLTTGKGAAPTDYFANCPLTDQIYDTGFDWELISQECKDLLSPYCDPVLTGKPLPSTTFPSSCLAAPTATST
ncbi:hypothetical protein F4859DRAFT_510850 [Xylaria cf. heliscus]|nr:hypothetical protein F4859DRAFT_510850 [Xylaria cf. heliscus]